MQLHWRRHLLVLGIVAATWIPVWALDYLLLGPNSSGWVPLDFRGFLLGPYIFLSLLFATITTAVVALRRPTRGRAAWIYAGTACGIVLSSALSFVVWRNMDEQHLENADADQAATARGLSDAITLEGWQPREESVQLVIAVRVPLSRAEIDIQAIDAEGSAVAAGSTVATSLEPGMTTLSVPIRRYGPVAEPSWRIRFLLEANGAVVNLEFADDPQPGDGALIVRPLPPPSAD